MWDLQMLVQAALGAFINFNAGNANNSNNNRGAQVVE
jgi:hypothetical protein